MVCKDCDEVEGSRSGRGIFMENVRSRSGRQDV